MKRLALTALVLCVALSARCSDTTRPWTFWYWMYGAVSKSGIKADLQAMKDVGLGGCYLMPIRGTEQAPANLPPTGEMAAQQLTPQFWAMVDYAMQQADSLGLEMGVHVCDGFALAGGPWITPEESMQHVVWSDTIVEVRRGGEVALPQPAVADGYYEDIASFAVPVWCDIIAPHISGTIPLDDNGTFRSKEPGYIQYDYDEPQMVRSLHIVPSGNNLQAQRLLVQASDDGITYRVIRQLVPPRQGWQNTDADYTYALPETTSRHFRFCWNPEGTEPGSEDLDAAKWSPVLKIKELTLSAEPRIDQWESKNGSVWRIAVDSAPTYLFDAFEPFRLKVEDGKAWLPVGISGGKVRVLRFGHTSTGHQNATAGGGKGLECDKFSVAAVEKQIAHWFGEFKKRPHSEVVKYMHVDSWECGSQNWSRNFAEEFQRRRGYDLLPFMPVYAGYPMKDYDRVLRDIRLTINDLLQDIFFKTVAQQAKRYGVQLSCESVAPTMVSDGMEHYKHADLPMGEFWLNSPTHDKPNDMLDAISGAHVYGKPIVQAEGFTEVRGVWDETPASIKPLLDRNFALGMNRLFFHVFTHNPYTDKRPGMTLDGIGLFFQRDQTWFPEAKALVDYITRCQKYLQKGQPVVDIAVYTGEEMPRRALTPDKLVPMLPGLFGPERVASERERLANQERSQIANSKSVNRKSPPPMVESPVGVRHNANILDLKDWVNPLHGYHYDSMNKDALVGGASKFCSPSCDEAKLGSFAHYRVLVIPDGLPLSAEAQARIAQLRQAGVTIIDKPYTATAIEALPPDAVLPEGFAFAHRATDTKDIYFLANQTAERQTFTPTFRVESTTALTYDPMTDSYAPFNGSLTLEPYASLFVIFGDDGRHFPLPVTTCLHQHRPKGKMSWRQIGGWDITFRESGLAQGLSLHTDTLFDWSCHTDDNIRFFSGHTRYTTTLRYKGKEVTAVKLSLGAVHDIAHVWVNGQDCGIVWMPPYEVDVTRALKNGKNTIDIEVVNTWHNALRGMDQGTPPYPGIWTNAKYRTKGQSSESHPSTLGNGRVAKELDEVKGNSLLPAGLLGPVLLR